MARVWLLGLLWAVSGCPQVWPFQDRAGTDAATDDGAADDAAADGPGGDLGPVDLGPVDLGPVDLGPVDLGPSDLGPSDLGVDLAPVDLAADAGLPAVCPPSLIFGGATLSGTLAVDGQDRPHLVTTGASAQHRYHASGSGWVTSGFAETGQVDTVAAAIDGTDALHVLYRKGSVVRLTRRDVSLVPPFGSWSSGGLVANGISDASVALAAAGDLVIGEARVTNAADGLESLISFQIAPSQGYARTSCALDGAGVASQLRLALGAKLVARTAHDGVDGMGFWLWNRSVACGGAAPLLSSALTKYAERPLAVAVGGDALHLAFASPGLNLAWQRHQLPGGLVQETAGTSDRPQDLDLALDAAGRPHLLYGDKGQAYWTYRDAAGVWSTAIYLGDHDGPLRLRHRNGLLHMLLRGSASTYYRCLPVP